MTFFYFRLLQKDSKNLLTYVPPIVFPISFNQKKTLCMAFMPRNLNVNPSPHVFLNHSPLSFVTCGKYFFFISTDFSDDNHILRQMRVFYERCNYLAQNLNSFSVKCQNFPYLLHSVQIFTVGTAGLLLNNVLTLKFFFLLTTRLAFFFLIQSSAVPAVSFLLIVFILFQNFYENVYLFFENLYCVNKFF